MNKKKKNDDKKTSVIIKNMTISGKLRFVNSIILIIPMVLSTICVCVFYISLVPYKYSNIIGYFGTVDNNANYAYQTCVYLDKILREQIEAKGDENVGSFFEEIEAKDYSKVYLSLAKNDRVINAVKSYLEPQNFEQLCNLVNNDEPMFFAVSDGQFIFRSTIVKSADVYSIYAVGNINEFNISERGASFYIRFVLVNVLIIAIALISSYVLSKYLNKAVFKRVEYSIDILLDGVEHIRNEDLSYRINYERKDEFAPLCMSFNQMADTLEASLASVRKEELTRKELIMGLTHDIFSPLTSIKAYVEGLQNGIADSPEIQKKYLEIIMVKSHQIEKLVSELLFLTKLEYNENNSVRERINLKSYLEAFVNEFDDDYSTYSTQIVLGDCDDAFIMCDTSLIQRMLTNIIDNSKKYSNKPVCHIGITLKKEGNKCTLSISDDGPGVAQASIDQIFDVFYRSDSARHHTERGSGLGLAIVSNIVERKLDGTVRAENISTGGLSVIIEIPTDE